MDGLYENPRISIENKGTYNFELKLYHTVNILTTNESGSGKTEFASCLVRLASSRMIDITVLYIGEDMQGIESINILDNKNNLVIIDDNSKILKSSWLKEKIKEVKHCTFLFITRSVPKGIDCFCEAVYKLGRADKKSANGSHKKFF